MTNQPLSESELFPNYAVKDAIAEYKRLKEKVAEGKLVYADSEKPDEENKDEEKKDEESKHEESKDEASKDEESKHEIKDEEKRE